MTRTRWLVCIAIGLGAACGGTGSKGQFEDPGAVGAAGAAGQGGGAGAGGASAAGGFASAGGFQSSGAGGDDAGAVQDAAPDADPDACVMGQKLGPGPLVKKCAPKTDNECNGAADSTSAFPNGQYGNGYDDDCDGLVDEGCECDAAHAPGTTKPCFLVPASQLDPATNAPAGWCKENAKGTVACISTGKGEFGSNKWDGYCKGAQLPFADDACSPGDFDCDGLAQNSQKQECACESFTVECPTEPLVIAPFPYPGDLEKKKPNLADPNPSTPFVFDGWKWIADDKGAKATGWKWTVTGGDCDNILPHPTFGVFDGKNSVASARIGKETDGLGTNGKQRGIVVGPSDDRHQIWPAFSLSGDYQVTGEFDLGGVHRSCTVQVRVRTPGLRVEMCWDMAASAQNGLTTTDLDLHVARLQGTQCTAKHGWFDTCGQAPSSDDCNYRCESGCRTGNKGYCVGKPAPAPGWGYVESPNDNCHGWGSLREAGQTCDNPRLDADNLGCSLGLTDPSAGGAFCGPENINLDNPVVGDRFLIGVHYYAGGAPVHPHVNVYCNGERRLSIGHDPTTTPPLMFPTLLKAYNQTEPSFDADMWEVATVRWFGGADPCQVDPVPSKAAKFDRDGSPAFCVDTNRQNKLKPDPTDAWKFTPTGSVPFSAGAACWHLGPEAARRESFAGPNGLVPALLDLLEQVSGARSSGGRSRSVSRRSPFRDFCTGPHFQRDPLADRGAVRVPLTDSMALVLRGGPAAWSRRRRKDEPMTRQHHGAGHVRRWLAAGLVIGAGSLAAACAGGDATSSEGDDPGAASGGGTGKAGGAGASGTGGSLTAGKAGAGGAAGKAGGGGASGGAAGKAGAAGGGGASGKAGSGGASGTGGAGGAGAAGKAGGAGAAGDPNCWTKKEICNGLDDNCNGTVDEGNPGAGDKCTVPKQLGECAFGVTSCLKTGVVECQQVVGPSVEVCDGKDNDCNGVVDDAATDVGGPCSTGQKGECQKGTMKCTLGKPACVPDVQSSAEVCDGKDNDCDGNIDNGFSGAGMACTVPGASGPCAQGQTTCLGGGADCVSPNKPSVEVCDGVDNDCNGTIDDPAQVDGKSCDTGLKGQCAFGTTQCANKMLTCVPKLQPGAEVETCDGKDNDCDGTVDNVTNIKLECNQKYPSGTNVGAWQCTAGFCEIAGCASNFKDCDGTPSNGCEVNITGDVSNCGACGTLCNATSGAPSCSAGQCGISCSQGFGDCDGNPQNGCEQRTSDSTTNCGICGKTCSQVGGAASCNGGTCAILCDTGKGDCDGNVDNGCETNTQTNKLHCSACGNACDTTNANVACSAGACVITSCKPGFADCNNDPSDGCEMNIASSTTNCGACGNACSNGQGVGSCNNGVCGITCSLGFGDCDGNPQNGCETNLNTSAGNCGTCGKVCSSTNGTASCSAGSCQIGCAIGWANCDGNVDNGCETDKTSDPMNCNGCGIVCNSTNGTAACQASACKITSCNPGFGDCDNNPSNGCETTTSNNAQNCGTCGNVCTVQNGGAVCSGGTCGVASCNPGTANCDGNAGNGCEVNTTNDAAHCGACADAVCLAVNGGNSCVASVCVPSCSVGFGNCDGIGKNGCETNTKTDANNCGACGSTCGTTNASSTSCVNGGCAPVCQPGWGNCDGNGANGCEKNVTGDVNNCGGCGIVCSAGNGTPSCVNGVCGVSSCNPPFLDCTGAAGCETNGGSDPNNCGGCGVACSSVNGTPSCSSGNCGISCNGGWGNCTGSPGCETNVTNDVNNCGSCGSACSNTANATQMKCEGSTCKVQSCAADWFDVDGTGANGCECKQDAVPNSCGGGTALTTPGTHSYNLSGSGADEDWFKVDFPPSASCTYHPRITLSAGSLPIKMQVYTACSGSTPSGGLACTESGDSTKAGGITSWEYTNSTLCGDLQSIDPTPAVSSFIKDIPTTVYIRVFTTGADPTKSCLGYSLTLANQL
ncbi:MAG: hypothetical protein IT374_06815, partial [Polyangiaceae bacterium]|nr:hypothetical protein [Polyangiaceae bacterium]